MEFTKTFSTLSSFTSSPSLGTLLLSQLAGLLKLVFGIHFLMEAEHWWTKKIISKYEIPLTLDLPCNQSGRNEPGFQTVHGCQGGVMTLNESWENKRIRKGIGNEKKGYRMVPRA